MELYNHQIECVNEIRQAFKDGFKRVILTLPTGGGKTAIFTYIARHSEIKGKKVWIICHRRTLLKQAAKSLVGTFYGFVNPNYPMTPSANIQICSILTLINRYEKLEKPDFLIIDECHHALSKTYSKLFSLFPEIPIFLVTATPQRLDGLGLNKIADKLIVGKQVEWLIENSYLAPYRYYEVPSDFDLSKARIVRGEYDSNDVDCAIEKSSIIGDAVKNYKMHADNMPALCFCTTVDRANDTANRFRDAGYNATSINGKTSIEDQDRCILDLAEGRLHVLCTCELIGEGVDIPVAICCIMLRPTSSLIICMQQWGRVLRYINGKVAIIIDHVGNSSRHGYPCDFREWSLEGNKKTKKTKKIREVRRCEKCYATFYVDQKNVNCPFPSDDCTWNKAIFENKNSQNFLIECDLIEVDKIQRKIQRREEEWNCKTLNDFQSLGIKRGHKPQWALIRFRLRNKKNGLL